MSTVMCKRCVKEHFSRKHHIESLPFFMPNTIYTSQRSSFSPHPLVNTTLEPTSVKGQWNQYHHTGVLQWIQHLVHSLSKVPWMHQKVISPFPLTILTCPYHCSSSWRALSHNFFAHFMQKPLRQTTSFRQDLPFLPLLEAFLSFVESHNKHWPSLLSFMHQT